MPCDLFGLRARFFGPVGQALCRAAWSFQQSTGETNQQLSRAQPQGELRLTNKKREEEEESAAESAANIVGFTKTAVISNARKKGCVSKASDVKLTWLVLGGDPVARSHRVEQFTAL